MEGLERLLAVTMGEDVKYRASFIKTHNSDVESLNIKNGEIAIGVLANFLYRKGENPVSIGGTVNIMDYLKKIENTDGIYKNLSVCV